jgi:small subunit ribosomal protein S13
MKTAVKKAAQIIRIAETDLDGNKNVEVAIRDIKGISFTFAKAVASISGLGQKKIGQLTESEIRSLEDIITNPTKHGIPVWLLNRRREPITNKDRHVIASSLDFAQKMDINEMKKIKCYKGIRHALGLPVRGQRTRSSFRKGKTVGVKRKKESKT